MSLWTDVRNTIEGSIVNQFTIGIPLPISGVIVPTGTTIIGQNIVGDLPAYSSKLGRYLSAGEQAALNTLTGAAKDAYAVSLGVAKVAVVSAAAVGGASGVNLAYNAVQGNSLTQNAGLAAAIDVGGLAAGAGIAASGIVDAAATTGAAPTISAASDLPAVDLSANAAPSIGGVDLTTAGGSSVISPVSSAAIDASATAPAGSSLSSILGGAKAAIGAVATGTSLARLINPPKAGTVPAPRPPVVAPAPPCSTCAKARPTAGVIAAFLPLLWYALS